MITHINISLGKDKNSQSKVEKEYIISCSDHGQQVSSSNLGITIKLLSKVSIAKTL